MNSIDCTPTNINITSIDNMHKTDKSFIPARAKENHVTACKPS